MDHLCLLGVLVCLTAALVLWMREDDPSMRQADADNRTVPPKGGSR